MIDSAISFAALAHAGQKRKYSKLPYIIHPIEVMQIVSEVEHDDDMLIAAVLHDVIEDTPVGVTEIERRFGEGVASLVFDLTEQKVAGNRRLRKAMERERLANVSARAQTIKLADLISNTKSIVKHDVDFARIYLREKKELLEILTKGDEELYLRAQRSLVKGASRLQLHDLMMEKNR